jgi:hypothetical protein
VPRLLGFDARRQVAKFLTIERRGGELADLFLQTGTQLSMLEARHLGGADACAFRRIGLLRERRRHRRRNHGDNEEKRFHARPI